MLEIYQLGKIKPFFFLFQQAEDLALMLEIYQLGKFKPFFLFQQAEDLALRAKSSACWNKKNGLNFQSLYISSILEIHQVGKF